MRARPLSITEPPVDEELTELLATGERAAFHGRPAAGVAPLLLSVLPCIAMMVAPREMPARLLPSAAKDGDALVADFVRFVMAGLEALAQAHRPA